MKTQIGGDRLGSGNKQEVAMKNFGRSSHDLGYIWRSSMSAGTLVPFMSELGLPGDTFDIDLMADVKTLPTVGPLYGSYKVQLDVFQCPVRLYQGKLHMNMLNIGMDMSEVLLPQIVMEATYKEDGGDTQQINTSSIYSYLHMRGLGRSVNEEGEPTEGVVNREFNGVPYLGYWDIYKNYYANKQEERGFVIHNNALSNLWRVMNFIITVRDTSGKVTQYDLATGPQLVTINVGDVVTYDIQAVWSMLGQGIEPYGQPDFSGLEVYINGVLTNFQSNFFVNQVGDVSAGQDGSQWNAVGNTYIGTNGQVSYEWIGINGGEMANTVPNGAGEPDLVEFPLNNIDDMRMQILENVRSAGPFYIDKTTIAPYGLGLGSYGDEEDSGYFKTSSQEGLGIKTYQSDLFNNWISTEWIDGPSGINEITAVSTAGGEFTIDSLNLANKIYNMLNRIAISGGSYDDWLDAVYTHERAKGHENPIYQGSLIKELAFEEVVSSSETTVNGEQAPLGTLAGRGRVSGKDKGGRIKVKVDEPSYIMGIVSITPRIDYSQGNKWDVNLKTMNDFHKPSLDAIGYQSLIADQLAWFSTTIDDQEQVKFESAGKQPAWINYMTNVNRTYGAFAEENNSMFMTLNRRYEHNDISGRKKQYGIQDLTTYIDPSKYNNIFAETSLDSQNFWVQIKNDIKARRKMSAKVIPNL